MKYLKRFNEDINNPVKDIIDLTNNYLVYLLDEGVTFNHYDSDSSLIVTINFRQAVHTENSVVESITWSNIKDYIIPYFEGIRNSGYVFDRDKIHLMYVGGDDGRLTDNYTSVDSVLNDAIEFFKVDNMNTIKELSFSINY